MSRVRAELAHHAGVKRLLSPNVAPMTLHRFLIEYCSLGVQMTAPVESWIRRAGTRCREIGLTTLGERLIKHAAHEAGHEQLFIADTKSLIVAYSTRFGKRLDAAALIDRPRTSAMARYIDLHEETILGPTPFAQVAIELEIEGLSVSLGPKLIAQFEGVLGKDVLGCLSFLQEHVALDVGHTALNRRMLSQLLEERPDAVDPLVAAGSRALSAYLDFLGECLGRAEEELSGSREFAAAAH
jgi:hypothetical protein